MISSGTNLLPVTKIPVDLRGSKYEIIRYSYDAHDTRQTCGTLNDRSHKLHNKSANDRVQTTEGPAVGSPARPQTRASYNQGCLLRFFFVNYQLVKL